MGGATETISVISLVTTWSPQRHCSGSRQAQPETSHCLSLRLQPVIEAAFKRPPGRLIDPLSPNVDHDGSAVGRDRGHVACEQAQAGIHRVFAQRLFLQPQLEDKDLSVCVSKCEVWPDAYYEALSRPDGSVTCHERQAQLRDLQPVLSEVDVVRVPSIIALGCDQAPERQARPRQCGDLRSRLQGSRGRRWRPDGIPVRRS